MGSSFVTAGEAVLPESVVVGALSYSLALPGVLLSLCSDIVTCTNSCNILLHDVGCTRSEPLFVRPCKTACSCISRYLYAEYYGVRFYSTVCSIFFCVQTMILLYNFSAMRK